MKKTFIFVAAVLFFLVVGGFSCKKGDTGPVGPSGAQGISGNTILSGNGAPANSLGVAGDFYLDLSGLMLYGPKTAAGWGSGVVLKGSQGPEGNADVKVDTFNIASPDWIYSAVYWFSTSAGSSQGYVSKYFDHAQALLSSDLIKTGQISIYATTYTLFETTMWTPLPYSFTENLNAAYSYNYAYDATPGKLRIFFFFGKGTGTAPSISAYKVGPIKVKLVMIAGTIVSQVRDLTRRASPTFKLVE